MRRKLSEAWLRKRGAQVACSVWFFFGSLSALLCNLGSSGDPVESNQFFPRPCPEVRATALSVMNSYKLLVL